MPRHLRDIGRKSISDIIAALALFRPGPLKGGLGCFCPAASSNPKMMSIASLIDRTPA
jgi:hypothetical protein